MKKQVVLIGESELVTQCAKLLLAHKFTIAYIHSSTDSAVKWANSHNVAVTQKIDTLYKFIQDLLKL